MPNVGETSESEWGRKSLRPMQSEERQLWSETFKTVLEGQNIPHVPSAASQADDAVRRFKYGPPPGTGSVEPVIVGIKD